MNDSDKIEDTGEAWEAGRLGRDESYTEISKDVDQITIDQSLGLQMISIRLQKVLIEDLKMIAEHHGIGYQPLIKQVLRRFADSEKKQIIKQLKKEQRLQEEELSAKRA